MMTTGNTRSVQMLTQNLNRLHERKLVSQKMENTGSEIAALLQMSLFLYITLIIIIITTTTAAFDVPLQH
jgi:hypothetical protein